MKEKQCIRTKNLGIRIADKAELCGEPVMEVHRGAKEDVFCLRDCVDSLYGKEYRCILVSKNDTVVL